MTARQPLTLQEQLVNTGLATARPKKRLDLLKIELNTADVVTIRSTRPDLFGKVFDGSLTPFYLELRRLLRKVTGDESWAVRNQGKDSDVPVLVSPATHRRIFDPQSSARNPVDALKAKSVLKFAIEEFRQTFPHEKTEEGKQDAFG